MTQSLSYFDASSPELLGLWYLKLDSLPMRLKLGLAGKRVDSPLPKPIQVAIQCAEKVYHIDK